MQMPSIVNQRAAWEKALRRSIWAAGLVRQGQRVLLIRRRQWANLTKCSAGAQPGELSPTLATMLERIIRPPIEPQAGILHHSEGMDLLPANIELSGRCRY